MNHLADFDLAIILEIWDYFILISLAMAHHSRLDSHNDDRLPIHAIAIGSKARMNELSIQEDSWLTDYV